MLKMTFKVRDNLIKGRVVDAVNSIVANQDKPFIVEIKEPTRSMEQNAKLWALLSDVSTQVNWHGTKLSSEDWKHVFTATLHGQKSVPNIDNNGFVVLGQHTSRMTVSQLRDLIELIYAFGAEHGVKWSAGIDYI